MCVLIPMLLSTCRGQKETLGASTLLPGVQGQVTGPGGPTTQLSHLVSPKIKFSLKNNLVEFISSFMNDLFTRLLRG